MAQTAKERLESMGWKDNSDAVNEKRNNKWIKKEFKLWHYLKENQISEVVIVPVDPLQALIYHCNYVKGKGYQPLSKARYVELETKFYAQKAAKVPDIKKPGQRIVMHVILPVCEENKNSEPLVFVHEMSPTEYIKICECQTEEYEDRKKYFDKQGYMPSDKSFHMRRIPTGTKTDPYKFKYKTDEDDEGRKIYMEFAGKMELLNDKMFNLEEFYVPTGDNTGVDEVISG